MEEEMGRSSMRQEKHIIIWTEKISRTYCSSVISLVRSKPPEIDYISKIMSSSTFKVDTFTLDLFLGKLQDSVPANVWPYFDPEGATEMPPPPIRAPIVADVRPVPEGLQTRSAPVAAETIYDLTEDELVHFQRLQSIHKLLGEEYREVSKWVPSTKAMLKAFCRDTTAAFLLPTMSVREQISEVLRVETATDYTKGIMVKSTIDRLLAPKGIWPNEGPDEWHRQYFKWMSEAKVHAPGRYEDRLPSWVVVWKEVPGMEQIVNDVVKDITGNNQNPPLDDEGEPVKPEVFWDLKRLQRSASNAYASYIATGRQHKRQKIRAFGMLAAHDSGDEDTTPYFNGAPPPTAVPALTPMEKTVRFNFPAKSSNKRSYDDFADPPTEVAERGHKCWGCKRNMKSPGKGLTRHSLRSCPILQRKQVLVTQQEIGEFAEKMSKFPAFANWVQAYRRHTGVQNLPDIVPGQAA